MEETATFNVKTQAFEGPLELLLSLVEKRTLFINDISLSGVADDYIEYLRGFERFPVGDAASFVLVASILVLIKSKSLLPKLDLTDDEKESIEELEDRLKEYKKIKELSLHIAERFGKNIIFPRVHVSKHIQPIFTPDQNMTRENILSAVKSAISKVPKPEVVPQKTIKKVASLEETINSLTKRITRCLKMSFNEFSGTGAGKEKTERITVVVSFLAMLELVKQGTIIVRQETIFSDIDMETQDLEPI